MRRLGHSTSSTTTRGRYCSGRESINTVQQPSLPRQTSHLRYTLIMSGANLNASTSTTSSSATTIAPRTSPSPRETQNGRFASLSPSKPGGLVRRPSLARQTTITPGAGGGATNTSAADRRRSLVNGAGAGVEGVKSPGELTVFVSRQDQVARLKTVSLRLTRCLSYCFAVVIGGQAVIGPGGEVRFDVARSIASTFSTLPTFPYTPADLCLPL